jgi:hypothetical protein
VSAHSSHSCAAVVCDQPAKEKNKNKIENILQIGFAGLRLGKGL